VSFTRHSTIVDHQHGTCFGNPSGTQNLEVASRFLENLWTYDWLCSICL